MKAGVIGTGWGARVQVPAFRSAGFEIAGIAGRNPEHTREVAAKLNVPAFTDWRSLLESDGLQLISIVTPPHEHAVMALAALDLGLHVLSEKPMALDASAGRQMRDAAEARPDQLAVIDHELRFLPHWQEARRRVPALGGLRLIEARFSSPGRGDRSRAWNWWSDEAKGGGVLGAIGSHLVDGIRFLTGEEIVAVTATLHTVVKDRHDDEGVRRQVTSDDTALLTLRLASGALAQLNMTVVAAADEDTTLTVHGERGGLRLSGHVLEQAEGGKGWGAVMRSDEIDSPGNTAGGPFGTGTHLLARALADALTRDDHRSLEPAATFGDGLAHQLVLDAARLSARNRGAWTDVAANDSPGSSGADAGLQR